LVETQEEKRKKREKKRKKGDRTHKMKQRVGLGCDERWSEEGL
jgi:hypothetical protein